MSDLQSDTNASIHAAGSTAAPTNTTATDQSASSHVQIRNRFSRQNLTQRPQSGSRPRRRSSILSYGSLDEARNSFHEDFIQPSNAKRGPSTKDHEITHWSSTPLAFAILPAVSGLVFKNGSAFVTDALLLTLAAVFMNWSIRVPREWYHSAQAIRRDIAPDGVEDDDDLDEDTTHDNSAIVEEDENEEGASTPTQPARNPNKLMDNSARAAAASQLRTQELLALLACFVFPIGAAYLLHVIRSQLSRPSESIVSDYNLSIFVLAAEFWPARQVIRLVAARTLHLQRVVSGVDDPVAGLLAEASSKNGGLLARIEELETRLVGEPVDTAANTGLQHSDLAGLDARIQKRLEPRLDSLERAVRRYEKRYATLAMVTEQRFQNVETRLQDTLALAAVAAQHSQPSPGILRSAVTVAAEITMLPAKLAWEVVTWPIKVFNEIMERIRIRMLNRRQRTAGRVDEKRKVPRAELRIKDDKVVREKPARKLVR